MTCEMGCPVFANARILGAALAVGVLLGAAPSAAVSLRADLHSRDSNQEHGLDTPGGYPEVLASGPPSESAQVQFLLKTLHHFKNFAIGSQHEVAERHAAEETRLKAGLAQTQDPSTKLAITQSVTSNQQSLLETQHVYNNMAKFADSVEALLVSVNAKGYGCEQATCGQYASCTMTTLGAQCICNEGYVGNGANCHAPQEFLPHPLLAEGPHTLVKTDAQEINVALFEKNKVAIVFRDASKKDMGRVIIGLVREAGTVDLAPPDVFTVDAGKAYSPVAIGTPNNKIAIAWRDEDRGGASWIRGGVLGSSQIRGADMQISWQPKVHISTNQAHKMAMVPLPGDRMALMYSDKVTATQHTPDESFGNSMLAEVGPEGHIMILGNFRFLDVAVCRLEVTKIGQASFVLAARAAPGVDDMDASVSTDQEAIAIFGEMIDNELVFDPNVLQIEPAQQIWARGISLVGPNTFAYVYLSGKSLDIKMAICQLDPELHKMTVVAGPTVVHQGFSPYVSMVSLPYTPADPHTLAYFEDGENSKVNLCTWAPATRTIDRCEDFVWLSSKTSSVAGTHVGGGKSLMVFSSTSGQPFYTVFGLSKK